MQLRACEILSRIQASAGNVNPVIMENHCANSVITKISGSGLCQDASHISILGMEFTPEMSSGFWQMLTQVKTIKCFIQNPTESQAQLIGVIHCTWNPTTRYLTASVVDFLSHVKIFYWRSSCIELHMELCYDNAIPSITSDIPHPAFGIKPPQSCMIMAATLHDNNQMIPNVTVMVDELLDPAAEDYVALDDGADSITKMTQVACKDGSFRVKLNSALLYSIIKEGSIGKPYPEAFKRILPVGNCEISILLKVFPFKSRSEYISVWAEVTAPPHARGEITLQVLAFDPQKEQRLGRTTECTEKLKRSDAGDCKRAKFTLDEVMNHTCAFYVFPDIELCVNVTLS